jgi:hypothetical protein
VKLAICGPGRSGKDTATDFLAAHTELRYNGSTSEAAAQLCFAHLREKYGYTSAEAAFADRHNHRVEWAEIIWDFNKPHGITLYERMLQTSDILNGIRRAGELNAMRVRHSDLLAVWIERDVPADPSNEIVSDDCDIVIRNCGTIAEFHERLGRFAKASGILRQ